MSVYGHFDKLKTSPKDVIIFVERIFVFLYLKKKKTSPYYANVLEPILCITISFENFLSEYIYNRLEKNRGTLELSKWLKENFSALLEIPR